MLLDKFIKKESKLEKTIPVKLNDLIMEKDTYKLRIVNCVDKYGFGYKGDEIGNGLYEPPIYYGCRCDHSLFDDKFIKVGNLNSISIIDIKNFIDQKMIVTKMNLKG